MIQNHDILHKTLQTRQIVQFTSSWNQKFKKVKKKSCQKERNTIWENNIIDFLPAKTLTLKVFSSFCCVSVCVTLLIYHPNLSSACSYSIISSSLTTPPACVIVLF